jgi:hypothetical protein
MRTESLVPEIADGLSSELPRARWTVEFVSDLGLEPLPLRVALTSRARVSRS